MSFRITRLLSPLCGPSAGSGNRRPAAWLLRGTENCGDKSIVCERGERRLRNPNEAEAGEKEKLEHLPLGGEQRRMKRKRTRGQQLRPAEGKRVCVSVSGGWS